MNEELTTVNTELEHKVAELSRVNNDMNNLLAGTGIATVFVDQQLAILRFTPAARGIIHLIDSDVGRPVGHVATNLINYADLVADTQAVLDRLIPVSREVQTAQGQWFSMRIQPYRTLDNGIEGAVLTFVEITETKRAQDALRQGEARMRVALQAAPISVFNQDTALRYTWVHPSHTGPWDQTWLGQTDAEQLPAAEAEALTALKQAVLATGQGRRQAVTLSHAGRPVTYDLTIEPLHDGNGELVGLTGAAIDLGERSQPATPSADGGMTP